jgi:hypothetical protein
LRDDAGALAHRHGTRVARGEFAPHCGTTAMVEAVNGGLAFPDSVRDFSWRQTKEMSHEDDVPLILGKVGEDVAERLAAAVVRGRR